MKLAYHSMHSTGFCVNGFEALHFASSVTTYLEALAQIWTFGPLYVWTI